MADPGGAAAARGTRSLSTLSGAAAGHAQRARQAHIALCERFERADGMLRRDGRWHLPGTVAHLWPFARAFVATLDLAGMADATGAAPAVASLPARRLSALERYWDERGPAYASDPPGHPFGGDIYYDDNAWVGLALVQLARLRPGESRLDRVAQIADFARGGWDPDAGVAHPGGIFWVQQGRGAGRRNHDRNAISTAPNAQVMLHLAELDATRSDGAPEPTPARCAAWVRDALSGPGGLIRDKIQGDGTIDRATWTYNQGSMIGLYAQLARRGGPDSAQHLQRAQELAGRALDHYAQTAYAGDPAEFVAIFMRNLLLAHAAVEDRELRARITTTLHERADAAWTHAAAERHLSLLAHSALVSLQALCAWDPADYPRLA